MDWAGEEICITKSSYNPIQSNPIQSQGCIFFLNKLALVFEIHNLFLFGNTMLASVFEIHNLFLFGNTMLLD